jgi:hypothetical protein
VQHYEKYAEDDPRQHKIKSALTAALNQVREEVRRKIQGPRPCSRSRPRFGQPDNRLRTIRARSGGSLIRVGPVRYLTSSGASVFAPGAYPSSLSWISLLAHPTPGRNQMCR